MSPSEDLLSFLGMSRLIRLFGIGITFLLYASGAESWGSGPPCPTLGIGSLISGAVLDPIPGFDPIPPGGPLLIGGPEDRGSSAIGPSIFLLCSSTISSINPFAWRYSSSDPSIKIYL